MAFASDAGRGPQTLPHHEEFRRRWGWFVALGIFMIVAGFVALMSLLLATIASVLVVGVMMMVSGVIEIVHGFQMRRWRRFFLWVVIGALYIVGGFFAVTNPLLASAALTLLLGFFLIAAGVARIVLAMQMQTSSHWGWVVASGIITLLLGAIIVFGWPITSLYTLGIFLGIDLIFAGVSWLTAGLMFRRLA
jgi:uncharacterized membrane protein HdeD (DUF308 family)